MMVAVVWLVAAVSMPGSGRVAMRATGCPPGVEPELRRLLAVELKVPVDAASSEGDTLVTVDCTAPRYRVALEVLSRKPEQFEVDTSDISGLAVPRTVALLVAEAVARLWSSPPAEPPHPPVEAPPAPQAPPPPPTPPAPQGAPAPIAEPGRVQLGLFGVGRSGAVPLFGGGLAADVRLGSWVGMRLDVASLRGGAQRASGSVSATLVDGGVTFDVRAERARWMVRGGVGLRGGLGVLKGLPAEGHVGAVTQGVLWGPQVGVSGEWRPWRWLALGLGLDGAVWAPRLEGTVVGESPVRVGGAFGSLWFSGGVRGW
ncbi:hypothetical protein JRI60_14210 [Archangium violaceum]|uniref:hypothetical protein n=1 Tax=Archangium violaceum TaxID=83451 RepID=UPI0019513DD2|nr:hypothetical protein [Archangium violaceum]QRO00082.1 hypothetical protein JRI60_14210 [Archangium violaceum]